MTGDEKSLWRRVLDDRAARVGLAMLGLIVLVSVAAPLLVDLLGLPQPNHQAPGTLDSFGLPSGPSDAHLFGVDSAGRDVLSRVLNGGRVTLIAAFGATLISVTIGVTLGSAAGYFGGRLDTVISRFTEVMLCFPVLLLALGLAAACSTASGCVGGALHSGVVLVMLVMGLAGWPYIARLVRSQTVALREREFVAAARVAGASHAAVLRRDILPNLVGPVAVWAAFSVPANMLFEAGLAFLGLGIPEPTASWGTMLAGSAETFDSAWWFFLAPTAAIAITAIAFNLVADGLRDALDPRR